MKRFLIFLFVIVAWLPKVSSAADRITATVTITNAPTVNGQTLTLNGDVRTWTNLVVTPASQILTNASIGGSTTNLFLQIATAPYSGPLTLLWKATNQIALIGTVGGPLSATASSGWATITLSTQTVTAEWNVSVPLTARPVASDRTNIASLLVKGQSDHSTNAFSAASPALANHVNLSIAQTVGNKTLTNATLSASWITNSTLGILSINYATTNVGLWFFDLNGNRDYAIAPDSDGHPSLYNIFANTGLTTPADYTPNPESILNASIGDYRYGQLVKGNTWTGTNTFSLITTSLIANTTLRSATHVGSAISSYSTISSGFEGGFQATNAGFGGIAIGSAALGNTNGVAIGYQASNVLFTNSTALGYKSTNTAHNQTLLGRLDAASIDVVVPDNLLIGTDVVPGSITKGLVLGNGSALGGDPASAAFYAASGEVFYRTAAASEGAGAENRLHNRAAEVVGSGSVYAFPSTAYARVDFGGTDPQITLPTSGTYLIKSIVSVTAGAIAQDSYSCKFYNSTDAVDIPNSERTVSSSIELKTFQLIVENIITVTASKTIQLYGKNATAARGQVNSLDTTISYVRLY